MKVDTVKWIALAVAAVFAISFYSVARMWGLSFFQGWSLLMLGGLSAMAFAVYADLY